MPDFGDGSARENYGTMDPNAPSVSNGQITPAQWAEYQSKRRRDAILGVLGVLGGTTALGAVGGAMGGGTAAAGSAGPEFGIGAANTGTWATPAQVFGTGAAGAAGAGAAGAAGSAAGSGAAGGAANTIANAGKAASGVFGGMDARDIMGLIAAITGTVGAIKSQPPNTQPTSATTDPQMQEVVNMMLNRMRKAEPLQDSALAMANGLLPTQYQNGGRG